KVGSAKGSKKDKIASDLRDQVRKKSGGDLVKVVLQLNARRSEALTALLAENGVNVTKFKNFNMLAFQLPASIVASLQSFPEVEFVSSDSEVR
ncbi:MAG: hypothetical protein ABR501_15320, partial [Pyrinomonadaceae bacterium]